MKIFLVVFARFIRELKGILQIHYRLCFKLLLIIMVIKNLILSCAALILVQAESISLFSYIDHQSGSFYYRNKYYINKKNC